MFGTLTTGSIPGVHIQSVVHEGLTVTVNGRPVTLAILDESGTIIATGNNVSQEAEAMTINCYKNMLRGQGHLRTLSALIAVLTKAIVR